MTVPTPARSSRSIPGLHTERVVDEVTFSALRRRLLLEGAKWDPQVGDVDALSPFPLVMKSSVWKQIEVWAEQLAVEAIAAEEEISNRPELLADLGFPLALTRVLAGSAPLTPAPGRVMRFDFHYTTNGWQISEVNSDVPGGFSEGSLFPALTVERFPNLRPAGDPAEAWTSVLAAAKPNGRFALLSAPGYMEDHQVIVFLAERLREKGCQAYLAKPEQVIWHDGNAHLETLWHRGPLDTIVRFYQAEWLSRLPRASGWEFFLRDGKTAVANSALAAISESKRFPLVWEKLETELPTWQALLPETRRLADAPWARDDGWLLKTAMCNNGDTVKVREFLPRQDWLWTLVSAMVSPSRWVAQRRFEPVPIMTSAGMRHFCVGVYTVNGRAAGSYTRLSEKPVIDFSAVDAALLIDDND